MTNLLRAVSSGQRFSSAVQRINYPIHQGKPNPAHGKFFIVGSIPSACYDAERNCSKHYDNEDDAIRALIAGGATYIQGADCRKIDIATFNT